MTMVRSSDELATLLKSPKSTASLSPPRVQLVRTSSLGETTYPTCPPLMSPIKCGASDVAPIYKFVLTGGPCAGKTTALARLSTFFRDRGFRVYIVPEAATIIQLGGASFAELATEEHLINFQWQILRLQMTLEDSFHSLAQDCGKPCVVLCDRGAMDGSAYIAPELWEEIKSRNNLDTITLRDTRYIAVFHLITAALGAESYYTLETNQARHETIEEAREVDRKTCKAWVGHPKLYVFDNSSDFETKMQCLVNTAARLCGIPSTIKAERKFRLAKAPEASDIPIFHEDFEVEKVYINPESGDYGTNYSFVRCRSQYGIPAYGMTTVRTLPNGEKVDLKRILTAREYSYAARHRADPARHIIKQKRICFLWEDQSFQIHIYKEPASVAGLAIVHVQASGRDGDEEVKLPPFLDIVEELTDDDTDYSAYKVSIIKDE